MLKKNGAVAITMTIDAPIRSVRYLDRESRYDARKYGKFFKAMPPDISYARKLNSICPERSIISDLKLKFLLTFIGSELLASSA